ncbi:MAG: F0F1 ATP synthase subunit B [Candidatus Peregrinibacteria bacterium]
MELLTKLGLQWDLILAQVVNFLIVMGLLGYFLYKPVLRLLDDRSMRIRKSMEEAKRIEEQAREMEVIRTDQLKKIDQECGEFLERAKKQAEQVQVEILQRAEKEAATLVERGKQMIDEERGKALRDMESRLAALIVQLSEKVIQREFTKEDQSRIMATLAKELPSLVQ